MTYLQAGATKCSRLNSDKLHFSNFTNKNTSQDACVEILSKTITHYLYNQLIHHSLLIFRLPKLICAFR